MCGINGLFGLEKVQHPKEIIEKMNLNLAHRGPDADGVFVNEIVAFGHRRLSIIDLDEKANQPMKSADGRYTLIFNGELYNFQEIKGQLRDYPFKTKSDSEVILAAFSEWGIKALQMFNGMFAFAIWDDWEEQLFVCRDRIGIKPLYYTETNNAILFSSEVRSLLNSGLVKKKLDKKSLIDYLRYSTVHSPNTIIEGIKVLEPGHYIRLSDGVFEISKYFEFGQGAGPNKGIDGIRKDIKQGLISSVEKRLVADVDYGAFLSGGIDSSIIVGIMSQLIPGKVNTFSVVFDEEEFSEAPYSRLISKKFNTHHHEIKLELKDFLELLPEALKAMDHPSGDGPNTYLVSKKTKEAGITMALSGLGGDELFAGYDLFRYCANISQKKWITSFPLFLRKLAGSVYSNMNSNASGTKVKEILVKDYFDLEYIYPTMRTVLQDETIVGLTGLKQLPENAVFKKGLEHTSFDGYAFKLPYLSKISLLEFNSYMENVLLRDSDQMSMASALEVRVPFLDHEFVDMILSIDDKTKFPHSPKKLLIDSFSDLLPDEVVNRKKMGFTFPWKDWMKTDLRDFCDEKINALAKRDSFVSKELIGLWSKFLKDDPSITWSRIWHLVVLEHWLQINSIEE